MMSVLEDCMRRYQMLLRGEMPEELIGQPIVTYKEAMERRVCCHDPRCPTSGPPYERSDI